MEHPWAMYLPTFHPSNWCSLNLSRKQDSTERKLFSLPSKLLSPGLNRKTEAAFLEYRLESHWIGPPFLGEPCRDEYLPSKSVPWTTWPPQFYNSSLYRLSILPENPKSQISQNRELFECKHETTSGKFVTSPQAKGQWQNVGSLKLLCTMSFGL